MNKQIIYSDFATIIIESEHFIKTENFFSVFIDCHDTKITINPNCSKCREKIQKIVSKKRISQYQKNDLVSIPD